MTHVLLSVYGVVWGIPMLIPGVDNTAQVNAVISGMGYIPIPNGIGLLLRFRLGLGLILAFAVGSVLLDGARRIGGAAAVLVPFVSIFYLGICVFVLILRRDHLPWPCCCFPFATILGWGFYGTRCAWFLFGDAASEPFTLAQSGVVEY